MEVRFHVSVCGALYRYHVTACVPPTFDIVKPENSLMVIFLSSGSMLVMFSLQAQVVPLDITQPFCHGGIGVPLLSKD